LSERDGIFVFRLPNPGEIDRYQIDTIQRISETINGTWTVEGFDRIGRFPHFPPNYLEALVEKDFSEESRDFDLGLGQTFDPILNLPPAFPLNRSRHHP